MGSNTKLEFPKFGGEGLEGWLLRCEYFFEVGKINKENRVKVAAIHLENITSQWHQEFIETHGDATFRLGKLCECLECQIWKSSLSCPHS